MREKRGVAPQQQRAVGTWRPTPPPPPPYHIAKIRNKRVVATPRAIGDVNAKVRRKALVKAMKNLNPFLTRGRLVVLIGPALSTGHGGRIRVYTAAVEQRNFLSESRRRRSSRPAVERSSSCDGRRFALAAVGSANVAFVNSRWWL